MEDLNARTEPVIGNDTAGDETTDQPEERIAVGDPQVDDEPEELKEEQSGENEPEPLLEPDDPE